MPANEAQRAWNRGLVSLRHLKQKKLSAEQADELARRKAAGERTKDLAEEFGVSRSTVYHYTKEG